MYGLLGMAAEVTTAVHVMDTQTVFTPCQSVRQQNMELLRGIQNTVHQRLLLPLAVEVMT